MKKEYTAPQIELTLCDANDIISNSTLVVITEVDSDAGFIDKKTWI